MRILLMLLLLGAVVMVLYRLRSTRQTWVRDLRLAGRWEAEVDGRVVVLELHGGPDAGAYQESVRADPAAAPIREQGRWHLSGQELCFQADGQPEGASRSGPSSPPGSGPNGGIEERCELRVFGDGSIGLHGGRRRQRVYRRVAGNVIALRRDP